MRWARKYHEYYIWQVPEEEGGGYVLKRLNKQGKLAEIKRTESLSKKWLRENDYVFLSRMRWYEMEGTGVAEDFEDNRFEKG